MLEADK